MLRDLGKYLRAVGKHWKREVLGGALIGLLALFSELSGIMVPPRIYEICAAIVLFYAMFLAWRDQAEALEIERAEHEGRTRGMLHPRPMIALQEACESNQARLFVQNNGATAEFYGVFTVTGLTDADPGETFYCKWRHTYSKRAKIPKGLGFWILLATRSADSFGFSRWEISAVKESEHGKDAAVFISATQSSNETSTPIARAADVVIEGSIVANPDAANGAQKFRVVLKAFEAALG